MIAAVVPVKALGRAKSRLVPPLARDVVERLVLAMLGDALAALRDTPGLDRIGVVTPDAHVAEAARAAGAEALLRPDPGLDAAVEAAAAVLAPGAEDGVLVLLGDVAGARGAELARLLEAVEPPGVAIAPSADGGTSALLRVPRQVIPASFGAQSAKRHRDLAERAGVPFHEIALPSLAIDLDEPEDVKALLRSPGAAPRTRALLRELGMEGA